MKKFVLAPLLFATLSLNAAQPNPTDYPIKAHVIFSRGGSASQQIQAVIDGQPIELVSAASGVLALGDYPARISPKIHAPKGWSSYDIYKGYDFLMPDGKVRTFWVTAMGISDMPAAPPAPPTPPANP